MIRSTLSSASRILSSPAIKKTFVPATTLSTLSLIQTPQQQQIPFPIHFPPSTPIFDQPEYEPQHVQPQPQPQSTMSLMSSGSLLPTSYVENLMNERFSHGDVQKGYILDGYPRNSEQASNLKDYNPTMMIILQSTDEQAKQRILNRQLNRSDDNSHVADKRIQTYHSEVNKILSIIKSQNIGLQIHYIDASNDIHTVFNDIVSCISNNTQSNKKNNIIINGLPGVGKGTQGIRLASHLNIPHISVGDLLRHSLA